VDCSWPLNGNAEPPLACVTAVPPIALDGDVGAAEPWPLHATANAHSPMTTYRMVVTFRETNPRLARDGGSGHQFLLGREALYPRCSPGRCTELHMEGVFPARAHCSQRTTQRRHSRRHRSAISWRRPPEHPGIERHDFLPTMGARPLAGLLEPRDDAGAPTVIVAAVARMVFSCRRSSITWVHLGDLTSALNPCLPI